MSAYILKEAFAKFDIQTPRLTRAVLFFKILSTMNVMCRRKSVFRFIILFYIKKQSFRILLLRSILFHVLARHVNKVLVEA